jgi:hypothetical protein
MQILSKNDVIPTKAALAAARRDLPQDERRYLDFARRCLAALDMTLFFLHL